MDVFTVSLFSTVQHEPIAIVVSPAYFLVDVDPHRVSRVLLYQFTTKSSPSDSVKARRAG